MRYTQPQSGPLTIDRNNPLGVKVIECIPLSGNRYSVVANKPVTYGPGGSKFATIKGVALRGSGAGSRASVPLNLSKYSVITIAFTMWWDVYANDDSFAMEFTPNTNSNAGGFYIDPNASGGVFAVIANGSGTNGHGGAFARPSAVVQHRYAVTIDVTAQIVTAYVDGVPVAITVAGGATTAGTTFANSTLNFFSRNGTDLLGTGTLQDVTFYAGALSASEVAKDLANPWQIYATPQRRTFLASAAPASISAALVWSEDNDTIAAVAIVTNRAAVAWSEAGDAMAVVSVVTDRGTLTWTEQSEAIALVGSSQQPAASSISAALSWAEASETSAIITKLLNRAALSLAEQGDTWTLVANSETAPVRPTEIVKYRFVSLKRDYNKKTIHFSG